MTDLSRTKDLILMGTTITYNTWLLYHALNATNGWQWIMDVPLALCLAGLSADFVSGVIHWAFDNYGSEETPVIGGLIESFRYHHVKPLDTLKYDFISTNADSCFAVFAFNAAAQSFWQTEAFKLWFWFFANWFVLFTNESHKWSHDRNPGPIVSWLQRNHLSITFKQHHQHHIRSKGAYCILNGWMNYVLDGLQFWEYLETGIYKLTGVESSHELNPT